MKIDLPMENQWPKFLCQEVNRLKNSGSKHAVPFGVVAKMPWHTNRC